MIQKLYFNFLGTDLLMNADYLGHYYQHYYPTSANYYLPQKLVNYTLASEIGNNWHDCTYTTNNTLNQEYQNESTAACLQLAELIDAPNNSMFSSQLSMEQLISNNYSMPLSSSANIPTPILPTTSQTGTQNVINCRLSNNLNETNLPIRNQNHLITNTQTLEPTALNEITKNSNLNLTTPITEILNTNKFYGSNQYYNQNAYNTTSYTELDLQSHCSATFLPNMYNSNSINNNSAAVAASAYAAVAVGNVAAANGFNFLSEVANTLLGQ